MAKTTAAQGIEHLFVHEFHEFRIYLTPMDDLSMGVLLRQERLTHMSDQSFLKDIISERMEMHYSLYHRSITKDEVDYALQLEKEYTKVLETLSDTARKSIEDFVMHLNSKGVDDEAFFYRKGVKDGLLLYELLTKL